MKRLFALTLSATLGLVGFLVSAEAQSQAGGLPAVSARVQVLEGIATTLQTQVTTLLTLTTALQTQVTTLKTDNTALQNALGVEIAARVAGDAAASAALATAQAANIASDNVLQGEIDALADQGTSHVTSFLGGNLVNGAPATLATLTLPPGNYLVIGRVAAENEDHNTNWLCFLRGPTPTGSIDATFGSTINSSISAGGSITSLTMAGTVTITTSTAVTLECQNLQATPGSVFRTGRLLAVKIGAPG